MKRFKILNGFGRLSDSKLLIKTNGIVTAMSANFAAATDLPALIAKRDAFAAALSSSQQGSTLEKALKDEAREALIDELHHVGDWVIYHCNNDRTLAMGSGFTLSKEENNSAPAVVPATGQLLKDGANAGELIYSFKKVPGAKSYVYEIAEHPFTSNNISNSKSGTTCKVSFASLDSAKRYWVRVKAIGKDEQCVYSEPISRVTQ